ncbi:MULTISPECIES: ABC transporter ATP-binding protein [unclassified Collinsella]|jgi:ABC-2 type transport system ATP-binding protein|uniref:ABC transporter ATP-binding protein n=1 Tax=unclassified Collinsella TaxID=2637548 RepID=UPI000E4966EE|nr:MULTISPECIES: ABC transporter ATP-binding protein [unclassified Collinsella]RGS93105.1 ABC transporter ATP-binding protein [Collinsella sp. AF20-14LB]RHF98622.1 ABC transporter ATP-binding protein [Collinsella sp. AM23-17]
MQYLLELKGVSRRVSDRFSLHDVTLAVEPGQIVGFVGANGAGKTTTIRAALGLIKLDAGEVHLFGQHRDANAPDETQCHLRSRIGLVLDTCPFPSTLKVGEVEALVGSAYPTWDRETFASLIDRFGLDPKTKVKDLSRGMGMKLQLACALSHNAKLLVLDEATAGLDPMAREELLDELLAFVSDGQRSVLLSSHITSDLDRAADRVICIDNGSIVFDLPREDITDRAGIAHCTQAQASELMACVEGARAAHHAYSVDVLVPNRREALEAFPEIPCDRATIDDYLRLMLKGASK